jgi:pimeloyl-ACP methyl ester carboxylesterase
MRAVFFPAPPTKLFLAMPYIARRPCGLDAVTIRGLRVQLYRWPGANIAPTLLLHGWGDTGETFQFLVDQLSPQRSYLACDMRGFGRSEWVPGGYWFADYLADLDALLEQLSPAAPIDLIGHSMGGNVAMLYAGARPERVRTLVSLEGFGLPRTTAQQAPARYRQWLGQLRNGTAFATYESFAAFERVLARRNPRTPADRLNFIVRSWGYERADGQIALRADPQHKQLNPVLYQREQAEACWQEITAPVLLVTGTESEIAQRLASEGGETDISRLCRRATTKKVVRAGHMMHHEQPEQVARLIDEFLSEHT